MFSERLGESYLNLRRDQYWLIFDSDNLHYSMNDINCTHIHTHAQQKRTLIDKTTKKVNFSNIYFIALSVQRSNVLHSSLFHILFLKFYYFLVLLLTYQFYY